MYSRDNAYSSVDQTDFSSVFTRATTADQVSAMEMLDEEALKPDIDDVAHKHTPGENRNLSSIISQIRDQGAALPQQKKVLRWNRKDIPQSKLADTVETVNKQINKPRVTPAGDTAKTATEFSANTAKAASVGNETIPASRSRGQWQPLVLILALAVILVMGFNIFQMNEQAIELKAALSSYQEKIAEFDVGQQQSSDSLLAVTSLGQQLAVFKQELATLKSGYTELDGRLAQHEINTHEAQASDNSEITTLKQDVAQLESGMKQTREELNAVKAVHNEVKGVLLVKNESASPGAGWIVNLASLSSAEQARIGVAMLEKSGKVPVVVETVVNGTKVYRLSVEGFATRDDAVQFINKARKLYGFDGGWVRQG